MAVYALGAHSPHLPAEDRHWIAPGAHVVGQVEVGDEVGIWFGATVRGDRERIAIGARSNVQEGAVLHTDPGFPSSSARAARSATAPSCTAAPWATTA